MSKAWKLVSLATLVLALSSTIPARAQCAGWDARFDYSQGLDNRVYASAVYDDGAGPVLYLGGAFTYVHDVNVSHLARWDGATWSAGGGGIVGQVLSLAVFDDGGGPALYVAGVISNAGGTTPVANIAKWNGASWSALGSGVTNAGPFGPQVWSLAVYDDGSGAALFASGIFDTAGGAAVNNIAKWNGSSWSDVGGGLTPASPSSTAMVVFDDGNGPALYVGGQFTTAGGTPANRIARWNGSSWSALGAGVNNGVGSLAVFDDGGGDALYVGGYFTSAGGVAASRIAKWNGSSWSPLGSGISGPGVSALIAFDDGNGPALYAGGEFTHAGGVDASDIAKWNGSSWSTVAGGVDGQVFTFSVFDGGSGSELIAAGDLSSAGTAAADRVAAWNGRDWSLLGTHGGFGLDGRVRALLTFDDGSGSMLYAGGEFKHAGDVACDSIAKWNGSEWSPLADGFQSSPPFATIVYALCVWDDGAGPALFAGGYFAHSGPTQANGVARWSGASWSPLAGGTNNVRALAVYDDGTSSALYAGGVFNQAGGANASRIAKWNGAAWSAVGSGIDLGELNASVDALAVLDWGAGSELYAGGEFINAGGNLAHNVARWNGTSWSSLGNGVSDHVFAFVVFNDGSGPALYAGGDFLHANGIEVNRIARWDGRDWSALGTGFDARVTALCVFDDGTGPALVACGGFTHAGSTAVNRVAKWNGVSWLALGGGVATSASDSVDALATFDDGSGGHADLFVGGDFDTADGVPSMNLAQWHDCFPGAPFCFGDGSTIVECPCANFGTVGHGCQNSAATGGAVLRTLGTTQPDTLVLASSGELPSALSIFLQGDAKLDNGAPFGDGVRCAGGHLRRLYSKNASAGNVSAPGPGDPSVSARSAALGDPIAPGSTRYYQTYYRDPNLAFCPSPAGNTWNVTNGVQVHW